MSDRDDAQGVLPLSRAQITFWHLNMDVPIALRTGGNIRLRIPIEPSHKIDVVQLERVFRFVVRRHEGLRVKVTVDTGGNLTQRVVNNVDDIPFRVIECAGSSSVSAVTRTFNAEAPAMLDCWLVRALVITEDREPRHLVVSFHHVIADGRALDVVRSELVEVLDDLRMGRQWGHDLAVPVGLTELIDYERSAEGRRVLGQSQRHFEKLIKEMSNANLPYPWDDPWADNRMLVMHSRYLAATLPVAAERAAAPASAVLLAALEVALYAYCGNTRWTWSTVYDNRHRPRFARTVACLANFGLLSNEFTGSDTFGQLAQALWRDIFAACMHSDHDYRAVWESRMLIAEERGVGLQFSAAYNYNANASDLGASVAESVTMESVESPIVSEEGVSGRSLFAEVSSTPGLVRVRLCTHAAVLPPDDAIAVLRKIELLIGLVSESSDLLVRDLAALIDEPGWPRRTDWIKLRGDRWADLPVIREHYGSHPHVDSVRVEAVGPEAALSLRAEIRASRPFDTAGDLAELSRAGLEIPGFVVPDEIVTTGPINEVRSEPRRGSGVQ